MHVFKALLFNCIQMSFPIHHFDCSKLKIQSMSLYLIIIVNTFLCVVFGYCEHLLVTFFFFILFLILSHVIKASNSLLDRAPLFQFCKVKTSISCSLIFSAEQLLPPINQAV